MLRYNRGYHAFDSDSYSVLLDDVRRPALFTDVFPYRDLPRIGFNYRRMPMRVPKDIWITDTTFRDGQQCMPPYTATQIVDIYRMLHRLGGEAGVIRQTEFFLYTRKDQEAVHRVKSLGYRYPDVTGWVRADRKDLAFARELGLKETGILTSVSDYHIFKKLRLNRKQAMDRYLGVVKDALEVGIVPRCHMEDVTRADFYGFVVPFAHELMALAKKTKRVIKVRICDTLGLGVPYPGVAMPRSVPGLIYGLEYYAGVPSEWMEWHGHNDLHMVMVNAVTAWLYGCSAANGTVLGIGERTGNPPIEGLVANYIQLRGNRAGIDTTVITELAQYFEKKIGFQIPYHQPLVGRGCTMTSAGVHADGILKSPDVYNSFDPERVLNRPIRMSVTDKSGVAGVLLWLRGALGAAAAKKLAKTDEGVRRIHAWITEEYQKGRIAPISEAEMAEQVRKHLSAWLAANGYEI